jgi:acyl-CoA synthetase (AMP-forming)/AMP-acid ligase II
VMVDPETCRPAAPDQVGEVWVRGPSVAAGYFGRPDLTATTFEAGLAGGPGYLRTGDLGFLRDGELYVTGRSKDLIIVAGLNHYPQDVELTVRRAYPAARQVAAFPVSHEGADELVIVVEARHREEWAGPTESIRAAVAAAHGIRPLDVLFGLPGAVSVTTSGKVRRSATRDAYLRGAIKQFRSRPVVATRQGSR